jgi:hypothetical protein
MLPPAWVDFVFAKLGIRYGEVFARMFASADLAIVKGDWAEVLDGISGPTITAAMDQLPPDRPPNALQFRAICRGLLNPTHEQAALPAPAVKPDPERMRRIVSKLRNPMLDTDGKPMSAAKRCALNLRRIARENGGLNRHQLETLAACESICGSTAQIAA